MARTIFHKIRDKQVPSDFLYEDDEVFVIRDIHPKAPTHLLFIPKHFIPSVKEAEGDAEHIPGMLILKAKRFAKEKGIEGYSLRINVGEEGGQDVFYIHLHFLAQKTI